MKNGYKITWSKRAINSLTKTFQYLEDKWTQKEVGLLAIEIEKTITQISQNPKLFQKTNKRNVRRAAVLRLNSIFYYLNEKERTITITSFFNNRQDPARRF